MAKYAQQHAQEIAECDAVIRAELKPLGDLDQLRRDIAVSKGELRYSLWFAFQLGYRRRVADEHMEAGTRPPPATISWAALTRGA